MHCKLLLIFIFFYVTGIRDSFGQNDTADLPALSDDSTTPGLPSLGDYNAFKLPPLQQLIENAVNNPQVRQTEASIDAARYDLKMEKRKWLSYISARAGYTYGILGTYVDHETEINPLTTTYTGSSQHSYTVGANISIPLDHLLSRGLSTKKQKKVVEQAECSREIIYNHLKAQVIETYTNITSHLAIMQRLTETMAINDANYKVMQNNFLNGKASPQDLATVKNGQKDALEEYESMRALLTSLILKLEILTNTKLINK